MTDEAMKLLRDVRPEIDVATPFALANEIIAAEMPPTKSHRFRIPVAGIAAAAAVAVIVAAVATRSPAPVDIALVASTSRSAFDSGRADVTFETAKGLEFAQSGTEHVAFADDDLEMTIDFDHDRRSPGFQARNRTVDGQFYIYDGVPGAKSWVRDTNASGMKRSDLFSIDPRTLLELLKPSADFEQVDESNGQRHLRARSMDDIPVLNLGLGPTGGQDAKSLDLWVGDDDIVRRIDLAFETNEVSEHSGAFAKIVRHSDGTVTKEIDPAHPGVRREYTITSSYSARFYEIGAPITITAPLNATNVAGQG